MFVASIPIYDEFNITKGDTLAGSLIVVGSNDMKKSMVIF